MKSVFFAVSLVVIFAAPAFASTDYLNSYQILPAVPDPGQDFTVVLDGWWPNSCTQAFITYSIVAGEILVDINVVTSSDPCPLVITPWTQNVQISGMARGLYPIKYRFRSSSPGYDTEWKLLGYAPVGFPVVQTCKIEEGSLVQEGGASGTRKTYTVWGEYSFAMTSSSPKNGWLTDVELTAVDDEGNTIDVAELFGLGPAVYFENAMYEGETYYDGSKAVAKLWVDGNYVIHLGGNVTPGCCDRFSYQLATHSELISHSACKKFLAADINKDCRVDLEDMAILASEWMSCELANEADCNF